MAYPVQSVSRAGAGRGPTGQNRVGIAPLSADRSSLQPEHTTTESGNDDQRRQLPLAVMGSRLPARARCVRSAPFHSAQSLDAVSRRAIHRAVFWALAPSMRIRGIDARSLRCERKVSNAKSPSPQLKRAVPLPWGGDPDRDRSPTAAPLVDRGPPTAEPDLLQERGLALSLSARVHGARD